MENFNCFPKKIKEGANSVNEYTISAFPSIYTKFMVQDIQSSDVECNLICEREKLPSVFFGKRKNVLLFVMRVVCFENYETLSVFLD